ncbi:hypothetical protein [Streptomyces litmocidini]|uniref:UbiC transcription regulator-associated domain-containing protein n=1 Tax=Streptomyces litmocidini TaxID=67318 RepID=A0ABW7UCZ6_9ACTN
MILLDHVLEPYELRMGQPGSVTGDQLRAQARALGVDRATEVIVLAGAAYAAVARQVWPTATAPLEGAGGMGYRLQRLKARREGRYAMAARTTTEQLPDNPDPDTAEQPGGPMTVTLTPVRPITPLTELESTVTGAPDEEEGAVTGPRPICTGRELQEITVITDGEDVPYRTDLTFSCPTWLPRP